MSEDSADGGTEPELQRLRAYTAMLETSLQETKLVAEKRIIHAELKAEAVKAGMIDLDGLKLIEATDIGIDEDGSALGAAAAMTQLRRDKPWLFGAPRSSSHAAAPATAPVRTKLATEMTLDEWRSARADLLRRR